MIFFFASGRFGNQIFQYAFIKSIRNKKEKIIVSGFEDIKDIFEIHDIINIPKKNRLLRGFIFRLLSPFLAFGGTIRLINKIEVVHDDPEGFENMLPRRESIRYTENKGLLKFIRFIKLGYFQSEHFFIKNAVEDLTIKSEYSLAADNFFKDIPQDAYKVFVHIRRGDYKEYSIFGKSTLLPESYYKNQIEYFIKKYDNCFFIFLSDEPEHTELEFNYLENKKISINNKPGTDFAIITKCKSGILSTSTFGWWAAYMIKDKGIIFAPKYWLGFNTKIEFPSNGFPSYAKDVIL